MSEEKPSPRFALASLKQASAIFRYLAPYRLRFAGAVFTLLVSTGVGLSFPYLTGLLLDAASGHAAGSGWTASLNAIALILLGTLAVQAGFSFASTYWFYGCGESAMVDLRKDIFTRLVGLPMTFFAQRRVGELSSRMTTDLTLLQDTLTMTIPQFLRQCLLMTGGITLVAATSLKLTGLMICTFPVLILIAILYGRRIRVHARDAQDRMAETVTVVEESLHGIANVKAFGNEPFELRRYSEGLAGFLRVILRTAMLRASMVSFIIFGIFGSIVLVFWYGAHLMQTGALSFGEFTRFILYTTFVGGSVASFADVFSHVQKTLGATERVRELLQEVPEIHAGHPDGAVPFRRGSGDVRFEQVSFRYPSRPEIPVLRELSLSARPGEKIALVGPSGAGKSTIVSLLLRFYEPECGRIVIDGIPAQDYTLPDLRAQMAIVPQEVLLFGGSIADNIRYGRPGATHEDVLAASRQAACHEFIAKFPDGYATLVGERGVKLSGGQRQRIAIARALLKNPAILLLDEATSALDSESEHLIQQALGVLLEGRTAFIIAHRLSTIRKADRIYVIEDGSVLESGTHDELLAQADGRYRRLAEMQFGASVET
ncbi:MAG TPA: ABC transporter transmembrane domain-containing protein [Terrimicrobiaceae bacterium]|nr:ABC transporter transmembrane domain-containing protein [Terrimicrobiaceae bacterium]